MPFVTPWFPEKNEGEIGGKEEKSLKETSTQISPINPRAGSVCQMLEISFDTYIDRRLRGQKDHQLPLKRKGLDR